MSARIPACFGMPGVTGGPVLVLGDGSPASGHAVRRAALVARSLGVPLHILCTAPEGARQAPGAVETLGHEFGIDVSFEAMAGDPLEAVVRAARTAALLVLGSARGNPLREWIFGTQAERLIRLSRVPVLVVKHAPAEGYRRVLVPLDLHAAAEPSLQMARAVARGSRMEVLHVLGTRDEVTLRVADVPEPVVRTLRQKAASRAKALLQRCIDACGLDPRSAIAAVGFGDAASEVSARANAIRADLVVIGKRRRGLLADFFLGGVTQRVLANVHGDVLVLRAQPAARPSRPGLRPPELGLPR